MYTIYFGYKPSGRRKIGCDENYPNRPQQQQMTNYRILEQHEDIFIASQREQELQREYGLKVDFIPYWKSIESGYKVTEKKSAASRNNLIEYNVASLGGLSKAPKKVEAAKRNIKLATEASMKRITCPHCNKDANIGNYKRWHGDKCKLNPDTLKTYG